MKTNVILMAAVVCAATANAGGWRFSAGPAWRSEVKMETRGAAPVSTVPASSTRDYSDRYRDLESGNWTPYAGGAELRDDPSSDAMPGDQVWAIGGDFLETVVTPGASAAGVDASDTRSTLGFKAKVGYDFFENEAFSIGLDLRFAGYWNMKASASGHAAGATTMTRTGRDWWLLLGGPFPDEPADTEPASTPLPEHTATTETTAPTTWDSEAYSYASGTTVRSRIRADLYQVGLGPTVTWHAFSWLDAYAGVAALANIAALDFEAGASKTSETKCLFGVAGEVGLAAYVTENLGLYAEVGYEWVDGFDASAGSLSADVDFSSLVISAGLAFRF